MLTLGPIALPWAVLLLAVAVQLGQWAAAAVARQRHTGLHAHLWRIPVVAMLAARLGFVALYASSYAATPWQLIDIRDGGWLPEAGIAAAALYCAALAWRQRPQARAAAAGVGVGVAAAVWWAGQAALQHWTQRPAPLPALATYNLQGEAVQLQALQGQPTVVNLWASWCPPCVREMPVLLAGQAQYPQLRFVWLNQGESAQTTAQFARQHQLPPRQTWLDPHSEAGRATGHRALPTTLFYDAQGQLQAVRSGELSPATLAPSAAPSPR